LFKCFFVLTYKELYMFYRELHIWIYRIREKLWSNVLGQFTIQFQFYCLGHL